MEQYHDNIYEMRPVHYAGFWARFFAYFIDGLILLPVNVIVELIIDGSIWETGLYSSFVTIIVNWLYFALQESGAKQATLGKRILDIKVIDLDGRRISFGRATGRYFGKIISALILLIGFIMAAFDSKKQALHDKIADTLVISAD